MDNRQGAQRGENVLSAKRDTLLDVTTEELPDAPFGRFIPLESSGLRRRSELVRSRRWQVAITIGEKT